MTYLRRGYRLVSSLVLVTTLWGSRSRTECSAATLYALYNMPPCSMILETTAVDSLPTPLSDGLLSETNGHNSGLSFPLRSATQDFLLEEFKRKILLLETQANAQDPTMLYPWYPMYAYLVGVDLVVDFFLVDTQSGEDNGSQLQQGQPTATLRVEIMGSLAFEEPQNAASKPSNDQVYFMFGQWMESIFSTQRGSYWNAVMASNQDLMLQATIVEISTGAGGDAGFGGTNAETSVTNNRIQRTLLSLLLLVSSAGVLYSIYALRRHKHKQAVRRLIHASMDAGAGGGGGGYMDGDDGEYNFSGSVKEPSEGMDAIRHGSDIIYAHRSAHTVLESTDRYLSKHRPDLYSDTSHDQPPIGSSDNSTTSNFQVFGREYTIPSNPFGILYNAFNQEQNFEVSPQGAFTPRRPSVIEEQQANNLAAVGLEYDDRAAIRSRSREFEDEPFDEEFDNQHYSSHSRGMVGFRPISSIWRNFAQMWDNERREPDDLMSTAISDLELQVGHFHYQDNVFPLDETHEEYDFPFKDFPRHDGTPCLIFNDSGVLLTPRQREVFEIASPQTSPTNHMDHDTMPVSDEAFQLMLAAQGANQRSSSPDDSLFLESSIAPTGDDNSDVISEVSSTNMAPKFKDELARLYEQKFRQYEKKAIVEKHQERREKERKMQREQERRERHKMMEGTIEDLEVATGTTPRWQSSSQGSSPKPYHYSPNQAAAHQLPHRALTHSPKAKYSPYRTAQHHTDNISRASPATRASPVRRASPATGKTNIEWDREVSSNPASAGVSVASGTRLDEPFRMRPRTMQPAGATTDGNFLAGHLSASSIDHSTLDKLSLPPMTSTKKYSPNAVMDDIFGGAPTSISRRKSNTGSTTTTTSGTAARSDVKPELMHRRVNSFDHKAVLGYERPLPQQRRRPKVAGPGTPTPRTRSRTPTRALTPTLSGQHQPQGRSSMNYAHQTSSGELSGSSGNSGSVGGSRRRRSASPAPRGDVFTHGVVAQTRLI